MQVVMCMWIFFGINGESSLLSEKNHFNAPAIVCSDCFAGISKLLSVWNSLDDYLKNFVLFLDSKSQKHKHIVEKNVLKLTIKKS